MLGEEAMRTEVYNLREIGKSEVNVQSVHDTLMRAHEPLNLLFADFVQRREFQHESAMLDTILELVEEFDKYIARMGPTR